MIAFAAALLTILPAAFLVRPFVAKALSISDSQIVFPCNTISLIFGPTCFLLFFSLWARFLPDYLWSYCGSLIAIASMSCIAKKKNARVDTCDHDNAFLLSFLALFALCFALRTYWPALHWENSLQRLGVERLFNLSLQQSFLYSSNWPPNNVWLNGEEVNYHLLLRAGPGIAAWLARVLLSSPLEGGRLYLIFDAWYLCLAPLAVSVWAYVIMNGLAAHGQSQQSNAQGKRSLILSLLIGLFTFLAPHGAALLAGYRALFSGNSADFWLIQHEVVKGTVNFFPFGLLLSGESHSYAQAPFLHVCLWASLMWQLATQLSPSRCFMSALFAVALVMAHPASTLLACCALGLVCALMIVKAHNRRSLIVSLSYTALFALALCLPELVSHQSPAIKWVWVTEALASKPGEFISAQAAPIIAILLLTSVIIRNSVAGLSLGAIAFSLLVICAVAGTAIGIGRSVLALIILIFMFVAFFASRQIDEHRKPLAFFILALSVIWLMPELIVSDWAIDNRTEWVRFNTVMRFWLDGYYLIPMVILALLGPSIIVSNVRYRVSAWLLGVAISLQILSLYPLLKNRLERTPDTPSTDGFAFMAQEYRSDWWIIEYLSRIEGPVVIAETCGNGSSPLAPYHYGMPGRIAAFSGRPSLCGWGRHTWMFQRVFKSGVLAGQNVWTSFLEFGEALANIYRNSSSDTQIQKARDLLRSRGVTHLIYGELEEKAFGALNLTEVSKRVKGDVVLKLPRGRGVIKLTS